MNRGRIIIPAKSGHHAYGPEEALLDAFLAFDGRLQSGGMSVVEMNLCARMSKRKEPWVVGKFIGGVHHYCLTLAGLQECLRQQRILSGPITV